MYPQPAEEDPQQAGRKPGLGFGEAVVRSGSALWISLRVGAGRRDLLIGPGGLRLVVPLRGLLVAVRSLLVSRLRCLLIPLWCFLVAGLLRIVLPRGFAVWRRRGSGTGAVRLGCRGMFSAVLLGRRIVRGLVVKPLPAIGAGGTTSNLRLRRGLRGYDPAVSPRFPQPASDQGAAPVTGARDCLHSKVGSANY